MLGQKAPRSLQRFGQEFHAGLASEQTRSEIKTEKVRGPAFCGQGRVEDQQKGKVAGQGLGPTDRGTKGSVPAGGTNVKDPFLAIESLEP